MEKTLKEKLEFWKKCSNLYYNSGDLKESPLSDEQFDELTKELSNCGDKNIESFVKHAILKNDGSFKTNHKITNIDDTLMVSLNKLTFDEKKTEKIAINKLFKELGNFLKQQANLNTKLFWSYKYDGNAVKIIFNKNKELISIQTRGGKDITNKFINHPTIKKITPNLIPATNVITGEIIMRNEIFDNSFSDIYKNPRNATAGLINSKDDNLLIEQLDIILYSDGINPKQFTELSNCWNIFKYEKEFIYNLYNKFISERQTSQYNYDGIVIGFETENRIIKENYPLNLVAIKFPFEKVKTKIIDIEWTIGKSNNYIPTLIVEPVNLMGSTINRCAGYSYDNVISNKLSIGSEILIEKAGDIIPKVNKLLITGGNNFNLPTGCYVVGKHLQSLSETTEGKINKFIEAFKILNIDGIGTKTAQTIGSVCDYDIIEIFNKELKPDIQIALGGVDSSLYKKLSEIYSMSSIPLNLLIEILQFKQVGKILSNRVALFITKMETSTNGIPTDVLKNVCSGDGFTKIRNSIQKLKDFNIVVTKPIQLNNDILTFEMTGNPPDGLSKNNFVKHLKLKYPNSIHTTLTKSTKVLYTDNLTSNTSKMNKARKYGIEIREYSEELKDLWKKKL